MKNSFNKRKKNKKNEGQIEKKIKQRKIWLNDEIERTKNLQQTYKGQN